MFSLLHKQENAHTEGIWTCAWGKIKPEDANVIEDKNEGNKENEETPADKIAQEPVEFIVTGGLDDMVNIWDINKDNTFKLRKSLKGHSLGIISVAVTADGKTIASSSLDAKLCIWDSKTGDQKHEICCAPVDLWTVAFSPCNKYVISGSNDGKITMYNVESGESEQVLDAQNGKFTLSLAYSPDGKYIASGAIDGIITIFDVAAGKTVATLEGHAMTIRSLCFSPDSKMLLTASDDGNMKLYDVAHSDVAGTLSGHSAWVLSVSFSMDGKHFASASSDTTVKIWNHAERKCLHTFSEHSEQAWGVKYGFSNDRVISVSEDRSMNLYNCPPNAVV